MPLDFVVVTWVLVRSLARGRRVRGEWVRAPFPTGEGAVGRWQRAFAATLSTGAPNAIVVDLDGDEALLHSLEQRVFSGDVRPVNQWLWASTLLIAFEVPLLVFGAFAARLDALVALQAAGGIAAIALITLAEGFHRTSYTILAVVASRADVRRLDGLRALLRAGARSVKPLSVDILLAPCRR